RAGGEHSSRALVAQEPRQRATRESGAGSPVSPRVGRNAPCWLLLRVGFAVPVRSPWPRCALTAPFHPCLVAPSPASRGGLFSVAQSFDSRRLAVSQHPCPVELGLSSRCPVLRQPAFTRATPAGVAYRGAGGCATRAPPGGPCGVSGSPRMAQAARRGASTTGGCASGAARRRASRSMRTS